MLLNCGVGEDSWESLGRQEDQTSQSQMKSILNIRWRDWCWSWNSNTLASWCEELTQWKRPWCWERLKTGGKGDDRGQDGWMASLTKQTWVCVNSGRGWRIGKSSMLSSMGLQRVSHDWATEQHQLHICSWQCTHRCVAFHGNLGKKKWGKNTKEYLTKHHSLLHLREDSVDSFFLLFSIFFHFFSTLSMLILVINKKAANGYV